MIINLPAGISVNISEIKSESDYKRVNDMLQVVLVPFKPIFDLVDVIKKIFNAIDKISLSSLDDFFSALEDVIIAVTKLLKYLPQLSFYPMMLSILEGVSKIMTQVQLKISEINNLIFKYETVQALLSQDSALQSVMDSLIQQQATQTIELNLMLQPVISLLDILNVIGDLIGITLPIPTFSGSLDEIETQVTAFNSWLTGFIQEIS